MTQKNKIICPNCGKVLYNLLFLESGTMGYKTSLNDDYLNYEQNEFDSSGDGCFVCPYCMKFLTDDEDEAINFLKEVDLK